MKTRKEIAKFMESQFDDTAPKIPKSAWHYGKCELRQLMDFIFDGPPTRKEEDVFEPLRLRNAKVGKWR